MNKVEDVGDRIEHYVQRNLMLKFNCSLTRERINDYKPNIQHMCVRKRETDL